MAPPHDRSSQTRASATVATEDQPRGFGNSATSAIATAPHAGPDWLERCYELSDREAVLAYLDRTPFLIPVLSDAFTEIQRFFEPGDVPMLKVIQDRESLATQLYVIVRTSLPPDAAFRRLDRFDDEWWLAALEAAQGALTIDVEPR